MAKNKTINFILIMLICISLLISLYGIYIIYSSKKNIEINAANVKKEIDNISYNNKAENKTKNNIENETNEEVINENAIGLIIFENGKSVAIYNNPTDYHMKIGVGKIDNYSVLNEKGNNILLGHNDVSFNELKNVKESNIIEIKTNKNTIKYKVTETYVTDKDDPNPYKSTDDITLTLITCYDSNISKRLVVIAKVL